MKIFYDLFEKHKIKKNGIISIGYFDSFHLGHQKLVRELVGIADREKKIPYVLTYYSLPQKNKNYGSVLSLEERINLIKGSGIRDLILCDYGPEFYSLTPDEFIGLLRSNFNINHYVLGKDFHFGKDKKGNIETLLRNKCLIDRIEPYCYDDRKVSTSLIRDMISCGNVVYAAKLMGRTFSIEGIVHKGKQLGRTIGFPTMNISNASSIYPGDGTYVTKTLVQGKEYKSMTYVSGMLIESNLFGYSNYKYNLKIKIDFFEKIRDNKPFSNIDDLKIQLYIDLKATKDFFRKA